MATAQGMSGIDVRAVTHELCARLPLWIDKIYQFETRTLGIRLNGENHAKYQLTYRGRPSGAPGEKFSCPAQKPAAVCHAPA